jgi:hypothetical protein
MPEELTILLSRPFIHVTIRTILVLPIFFLSLLPSTQTESLGKQRQENQKFKLV